MKCIMYDGVLISRTSFLSICFSNGIHARRNESIFSAIVRLSEEGNEKAKEIMCKLSGGAIV